MVATFARFDLRSYRRHLGIVNQAPFLFAGTVAEQYPLCDATPGR